MQQASEHTVLGNFENARFDYAGKTTRFFRQDGEFRVETEGASGSLETFTISHVFGVDPLQQYLIPFPDGRLQTLGIAWDARPREAGGQRWFHLYPDESITAGDPLHWTGPYQNWNLQCADCHSTHLQKNYDANSGSYRTTWSEIDVACEACHGAGAKHVALATDKHLAEVPTGGFPVDLSERGDWAWQPGEAIAARRNPLNFSQQVEVCGRCHSRRGPLGQYEHGDRLTESYRLSTLRAPLYHADGQILDEVYVYGSFLQSRMHQAGVVCTNCHNPHSGELRAEGNGVCSQCHRPDAYDNPSHHHHARGSSGASCANCHMPEKTYMVVDPRRDHSMRIPRPDLSVVIGTPNACNRCHSERDPEWALARLRDWGVEFRNTGDHPARAFEQAGRGDSRAVPVLAAIARDESQPLIWRATAASELGSFPGRESLEVALPLLQSPDPLLRWSAVRALEFLPLENRYAVLQSLLDDSNGSVRMELARLLAGVPLDHLQESEVERLEALFADYIATLYRHADVPETQLELGAYFALRQSWAAAEQAYSRAIKQNPQLAAAYLNLADLYRSLDRDAEGRALLLEATRQLPEQGVLWHALGLLETRQGQRDRALEYLQRSADLEHTGMRHRYVYAIALHDQGRLEEALLALKRLLRDFPQDTRLLMALAEYSREAGNRADALRYAGRLRELIPGDPAIQRFYESL
jgi:predicted CXXCH cytochrome family protein